MKLILIWWFFLFYLKEVLFLYILNMSVTGVNLELFFLSSFKVGYIVSFVIFCLYLKYWNCSKTFKKVVLISKLIPQFLKGLQKLWRWKKIDFLQFFKQGFCADFKFLKNLQKNRFFNSDFCFLLLKELRKRWHWKKSKASMTG